MSRKICNDMHARSSSGRAPDRAESGLVRIARGARDKEAPLVDRSLLISITETAGAEIGPHNIFALVCLYMYSRKRDVQLGGYRCIGGDRTAGAGKRRRQTIDAGKGWWRQPVPR